MELRTLDGQLAAAAAQGRRRGHARAPRGCAVADQAGDGAVEVGRLARAGKHEGAQPVVAPPRCSPVRLCCRGSVSAPPHHPLHHPLHREPLAHDAQAHHHIGGREDRRPVRARRQAQRQRHAGCPAHARRIRAQPRQVRHRDPPRGRDPRAPPPRWPRGGFGGGSGIARAHRWSSGYPPASGARVSPGLAQRPPVSTFRLLARRARRVAAAPPTIPMPLVEPACLCAPRVMHLPFRDGASRVMHEEGLSMPRKRGRGRERTASARRRASFIQQKSLESERKS